MARRMFTEMITRSDAFLDMPPSTQALYFHLLSEADDDGFVSSPKMVMRIVGASSDEIRTLVSKKFVIPFEGGICVIKHWRMHNQIRKDRYIETKYKKEKHSLFIRQNGAYSTNSENATPVPSGYFSMEQIEEILMATNWQPTVALGKGSVGQGIISDKSQKDMGWKTPYNENTHTDDIPSIGDDGEVEKDAQEEQNKKVTELIEWAETIRKQKFLDKPTQRKMVHEMRKANISPFVIRSTFKELLESEYWKGQTRLPDFKTVFSNLKNKKHE